MGKIEVLCLGTGNHLTGVYEQVATSSFVLLADGFPVMLIGCGLGTARACQHYAHLIPECIFLLNSTPSQCAELTAIVAAETTKGRKLRIFAEESICLAAAEQLRRETTDDSCAPRSENVSLIRLPISAELLPLVGDFSVLLHANYHRRQHPAVAPVFFFKEMPIVALTGPAVFDTTLYAKLCTAPFVIVWGTNSGGLNDQGNIATINEITMFADKVNAGRPSAEKLVFLVTGYGSVQEQPMGGMYVSVMQQGMPVVILAGDFVQTLFTPLQLPLPNVRKVSNSLRAMTHQEGNQMAANNAPMDSSNADLLPRYVSKHTAPVHQDPSLAAPVDSSGFSGLGARSQDNERGNNRRVFIFNNDNKGLPGKLMMLNQVRSLDQLKQRVSMVCKIKPIKDLVYLNGKVVHSIDEINDKCEIVAIRRGGTPYDEKDLPRLIKTK